MPGECRRCIHGGEGFGMRDVLDVKKIIKYAVFPFLAALLVEGFILTFTDNKMYDCPLNAVSSKKYEDIDDLNWMGRGIKDQDNLLEFIIHPQDYFIRTVYFQFQLGSKIEYISYDKNSGGILTNVDSSTSALVVLPDCTEDYTIIISGDFVLKDYLVSSDPPGIVKKTILNPFRIFLIYFVVAAVCIKKDVLKRYIAWLKSVQIRRMMKGILVIAGACAFWCLIFSGFASFLTNLNRYHIRFSVISGFALTALVCYALKYIKKIESLWLVISALFILCCVVVYPVFPYGGDSEKHMERSLDVAQAYDENDFQHYCSIIEEDKGISIHTVDKYIETANMEGIHSHVSFKYKIFRNIRYISYIPYAAGLVFADALNFKAHTAFLISELVNGWFCCILYYLAMKRLKYGKLVLAIFASLPFILVLISRYSYTSWVIAWITYGSASVIGTLQSKRKIRIKDLLPVYGAFLMGGLPKAPYMFTVLLTLLIPKKRFDKKIYKANILMMALTIIILFLSLVFPIFTDSRGVEIYSDIRGGEKVNAIGQLIFMLKEPLLYLKILIVNLCSILSPKTFIYGGDGFVSLGSTIGKGHWVHVPLVIVIIFIFVIVTDKKNDFKQCLPIQKRLFIFALTVMNMCVICSVLYMSYSEVGEETIAGVNPLYLLTFMFPFFYCIGDGKIKPALAWRKYNILCYGVWMLIMFWTIFTEVVSIYYS